MLDSVPDTSLHLFAEYLRLGIPVCLNTDDRGSWDSNLTDEYYTAVTNFQLTWKELVILGRNSLLYSFAEATLKEKMLRNYDSAVTSFETRFNTDQWPQVLAKVKPLFSGYTTRTWGFHD